MILGPGFFLLPQDQSQLNGGMILKWHRVMLKKWAENISHQKYEFNQLLSVKDYHFFNFIGKIMSIGTLIYSSLPLKPKCSPVLSIEKNILWQE